MIDLRVFRRLSSSRMPLAALALSFCLAGLDSSSVWADGGNGGSTFPDSNGGTGGAGTGGIAGSAGTAGVNGGGGGGGGAAGGGAGGTGFGTGGTGGAGGTSGSPNGQAGASGSAGGNNGGGGGGGGFNGTESAIPLANTGLITGGNGGSGGNGAQSTGVSGGGGGGAGGYGAVVSSGGTSVNSGSITGGTGGIGGTGNLGFFIFGASGNGGDGGVGLQFTTPGATFMNIGATPGTAAVTGGNGGAGGSDFGIGPGSPGLGGQGIVGSDLTVLTNGLISGGLHGDGVTRANAITFTGGVNILEIQPGYLFTGNVVANSAADLLRLGGTGTATFNLDDLAPGQAFQNFGNLEKTGSSTWTLIGTNTSLGTTTLNAGELIINGSIVSATTINAGAILGGNGTVGAIDNSAGVVSPGDGTAGNIGTLTISAGNNYTQGAAGSLRVDIDPFGLSDLLQLANGTANLAGGLDIHGNGANGFSAGTVYTLINANTIVGTFDPNLITDDLPLLNFIAIYNANSVQIQAVLSGMIFSQVASTSNQKGVAGAFDAGTNGATGDLNTVAQASQGLNTAGVQNALDQLSGEHHASTSTVQIEQTTTSLRTTADYLRSLGDSESDPTLTMHLPDLQQMMARVAPGDDISRNPGVIPVSMTHPFREVDLRQSGGDAKAVDKDLISLVSTRHTRERTWDAWALGYGTHGSIDGDGNAHGIGYNVAGSNFGIGYWIDDRTIVGVLGGYAGSSVKGGGNPDDRSQIDATMGGVYARISFDSHYVLGIVTYGRQETDSTRQIQFGGIDREAKANYSADEFATWWEYGQNRQFGGFVVQPLVAAQYVSLWQDSFTETSAGAVNLVVNSRTNDSFRSSLGGRLLMPLELENNMRLTPEISARWMHEFLDDGQTLPTQFSAIPGATFRTKGVSAGQDFALFGSGATLQMSEAVSLYAHYIGQASNQLISHTGLGGLTVSW